jgi:hypothetical protein
MRSRLPRRRPTAAVLTERSPGGTAFRGSRTKVADSVFLENSLRFEVKRGECSTRNSGAKASTSGYFTPDEFTF